MTADIVKITIELTRDEARAIAQFLKRADHEDFERRAADRRESDLMYDAALAIREGLRSAVCAPR